MHRTIKIDLYDVTDDEYENIANTLCSVLHGIQNGRMRDGEPAPWGYWVHHDGGHDLSRKLNAKWDEYGRNSRWT